MKAVVSEIMNSWAHEAMGQKAIIKSMPTSAPAWTVTLDDGSSGVAIALEDDLTVNEEFSSASIKTMKSFGDQSNLLVLSSPRPSEAFAFLCAEFLEPGPDGETRAERLNDPVEWWTGWKSLVGNKSASRLTYDTVAELASLWLLKRRGENPSWRGPLAGRYDIDCGGVLYEVKSTVARNSKRAHVHGLFQLDPHGRKEVLLYCRMEEAASGISIGSLADKLVQDGYDQIELESCLEILGYPSGRSDRNRKYAVLAMESFVVDEAFPHIEAASFLGGGLPSGVESINYEINLSGIKPDEIIDTALFASIYS